MNNTLIFQEYDYDLDGLLRKAESAMADFIFMIGDEDELNHYYIDRIEGEKYDSTFNRFMLRAKNYLESDESRALFILLASIEGETIRLFDGNNSVLDELDVAELNFEEDCFYGMIIQYSEESYVFHEALYKQPSYRGDAYAETVQDMGELTKFMEKYVLEFS